MRCYEPRESGEGSALLTLGSKCTEMFRFSPSGFFFFSLFVKGERKKSRAEKDLFGVHLGLWLLFVGWTNSDGGTKQHPVLHAGWHECWCVM